VGTPAEVFHNPASEFVIDFLGNVNVFHGRIEQGRAIAGDLSIAVPRLPGGESKQANLYVRPHELQIERRLNGSPAIAAAVARINPAGSVAKIALTAHGGGDIQVELPEERFRELALVPGETVYVSAKKVRVFTPEYSI
jgi:sulfate transport system ATP-binding protein